MIQIIPIKLSYSNAYLLKGRKTILVDTGAPGEGLKILRTLARIGIEPKNFSLILHTHAHFDHAGSTLQLKGWIDVPTAIHEADAAMLARGQMNPLTALGLESKLLKLMLSGMAFPAVKADIVIKDEISLKDFGVDGKITFTPGHTTGSLSILLNNGDAIVGDLMRGGDLGGALFPSQPRYHYYADDLEQMRASIQKIMALKPKRLYVGHGGPLDAQSVKTYFSKTIQF